MRAFGPIRRCSKKSNFAPLFWSARGDTWSTRSLHAIGNASGALHVRVHGIAPDGSCDSGTGAGAGRRGGSRVARCSSSPHWTPRVSSRPS
jgi:hypothetical protein